MLVAWAGVVNSQPSRAIIEAVTPATQKLVSGSDPTRINTVLLNNGGPPLKHLTWGASAIYSETTVQSDRDVCHLFMFWLDLMPG